MRPSSRPLFLALHLRQLAPRALVPLAAVLLVSASPGVVRVAHAQSAGVSDGDRAAARELYIEGVKLQEQGKFEAALERFQRAQSVFSAPTHLLHIAECQAAMGRLVESAETYRTLVRTPLPTGSPAAFTQAQQQGSAELTQVEPRIPTLKLHVKPDAAQNLSVQIDGQSMSAALVGVARPINPGAHTVSVSSPGFGKSEQQVTVKEKEQKDLTLTLQSSGVVYGPAPTGTPARPTPPPSQVAPAPIAPAPAPYGAPPPVGERGEKDRGEAPAPPVYEGPPAAKKRGGTTSFMVGPRVGVAIPGGNLASNLSTSDEVGVGPSFGLEGGLRFARIFYVGALLDHAIFSKGSGIDTAIASLPAGTKVSTSGSSNYFGISFAYISNPDGFGFYGEIGGGYRWLALDRSATSPDGSGTVDITQAYRGVDGMIGVGVHLKPAEWLRIVPKITYSVGTFKSGDQSCTASGTANCTGVDTLTDATITASDTHSLVFIGAAGFFDFGRRAPQPQ
jgi:hypothetical protein